MTRLDLVAALDDGPIRMQKQVGTRNGSVPNHIVVACQSIAKGDAERPVDRGHFAEAGEECLVRARRGRAGNPAAPEIHWRRARELTSDSLPA